MLAYIMVKDGEVQVIPVEVNLYDFTHITVRNRVLPRSLLMSRLHYYDINGSKTAVFLISKVEFETGKLESN